MTDHIRLNPGSQGAKIGVDVVNDVAYQTVKLIFGSATQTVRVQAVDGKEIPTQLVRLTSVQTAMDTNLGVDSTTFDKKDRRLLGIHIVPNSGGHGTHILTLEVSDDNANWVTTATTIARLGVVLSIAVMQRYVKMNLSTSEGGSSSVNIHWSAHYG